MDFLKNFILFISLSVASTFNEFLDAVKNVGVYDGIVDFLSRISNYLSWEEVTLEAIVFPILGLYTVKWYLKFTNNNKTIEDVRKQIDELNEDLKKLEKDEKLL